MSRIAARSGKVEAAKPEPITVVVTFRDGHDEEIVVDRLTFSYLEVHRIRTELARITERDEQGRPLAEPDPDIQVLAGAWVVRSRDIPCTFVEFLDLVEWRDGLQVDAAVEVDDSPEA